MADMYIAPPGPPPPKAPVVPAGWLAKWNEQYKEWFYVNTITKKSQWEKPTLPARPPEDIDDEPSGPPPSYTPGDRAPTTATDTKRNPYDDDNDVESEDAKLARRLQDEEDAKARGFGAGSSSGSGSGSGSAFPNQLPPRPDDRDATTASRPRGLLGKIFGGSSGRRQDAYAAPAPAPAVARIPSPGYRPPGSPYGPPQQQPYGQPAYGGGGGPQYGPGPSGYGPPPGAGGYGGYPPPQQGGYYQEPPQGYYGGGGGGGYVQESRPAKTGGGLGTAGGAALGLGAGLVGGMLLEDVIQDHDQSMYQQGFDNGEMADGGGDFGDGGGDFGGGDF